MKICAILLAAGQASRMKAVKALLPLPVLPGAKHCSALEALARLYREAGVRDVIAVSGHHAAEVEAAARSLGLVTARNPEPEQGMFSSVRVGLRAVAADCDWIFVHPVDVPLVRPLTVRALLEGARAMPRTVLIPGFEGREGHPPLLPAGFAKNILAHRGGQGLRGALAALPRRLMEVADSFILEDMDRPEDYARLRALAPRRATLAPAEARCLLREHGIPKKGLRHAEAVGAVAHGLALALQESRAAQGVAPGLDPSLALAGGLLHDICKGQAKHEAAAGRLLEGLGLPVMAALAADHRDLSLPEACAVGERELVYLADKYCRGGDFVSLEQRFGQKLALYAADPEACAAIRERLRRAKALEARLARELGQEPAHIARRVLQAYGGGGGRL